MRGSASKRVGLILGAALLSSTGAVAATELPDAEAEAFGEYQLVPLLENSRAYAGPPSPTSLDDVQIGSFTAKELSSEALARLEEQGFVVVPSRFRLFHDAYSDMSWDGTPTFVTTDVAYHSWHLVFDKVLREVEQQRLLPALEQLVEGMRHNAAVQAEELAGTALEDDAARVHDLLAATAAVLGLPGDELGDRAQAEVALITEHASSTKSPILDTLTDYSLFAPRGHYTRNEDLERFFNAMSALGQHAFPLPGARDSEGSVSGKTDGLRRALLASRTLVGHPELEKLWREIFEPTAFLVGVSDDYSPFELETAVEATVPGGWVEPLLVADDEAIGTIAGALTGGRPVRIDPERPSVRLMGTRFVLDSWIFDQLVSPNVGTQLDPRALGSPLDLAAAFGSDFALAIQDEAGQTAKANYPVQMKAMRSAVAGRPDDAWGRTVYDAWLAAVAPMWLPHGEAFADFMRSDAWRTKSQQTGLASYAELKHDTILYAKQATGDTGGGPEPARFRMWVEPDPVPFQRLSALARLTRDGLVAREILPKEQRQLLDRYIKMADRFARIAAMELAGEPSSKRDNEWLTYIGNELESLWMQSGDLPTKRWEPDADEDAAVVADIMRGIDTAAGTDQVLEVGTGYVDRIYVIVPDDEGSFRLAAGGVYSYYEFPWPTTDRLNDARWRKLLATDQAPARPAWQAVMFPESGVGSDGTAAPTPKPSKSSVEWELGETIEGASWKPYRKSPAGATFDPFAAGARTGVIFDKLERQLHRAVDYVVLFRFDSADGLKDYWAQRASAAASAAPERARACLDGQAGRSSWSNGEYLCYVSEAGDALLRWTDERTDTYGVMNAVADEARLKVLARQWESIVSP